MFIYPTPTTDRQLAVEAFYALRMDALRDSLMQKLVGRKNSLLIFPDNTTANFSNRRFLGVQEIPIEKVNGTMGRDGDFDAQFRPVKKHLRDRWVNVFTKLEPDGWPPILVHKIGDIYYVEDGHHRTSVARSLGRAYISAEVWEYPANSPKATVCQPLSSCMPARPHPAEACAAQ